MNSEKLIALTQTDLSRFQPNEQNVKYNIVLTLLNCFGYDQLDLEHAAQGSRIDINIGNKIIVETKALDKNLDHYVSQVKQYCDIERPNLAILTNGRSFRFYSPFMRVSTFEKTLLYEFTLQDFSNQEIIERVNKLIGFENYNNGTYLTYIEERENELKQVFSMMEDHESKMKLSIAAVEQEVQQLKSEIEKLQSEIGLKNQTIERLKEQKAPQKEELYKRYFVPTYSTPPLGIQQQPKQAISKPSPIIQPQPASNTNLYKIQSTRAGAISTGRYYDNTKFTVLKGSTVSIDIDPTFGKGVADSAYLLREELKKSGIINQSREFTEDYTFSSISQAACVVLGGSRSGPREWRQS